MKENQQIKQLENKVIQIQIIIDNWKQEIIKYEATLEEIKKEVSQLKINSNNSK